MIALRDYQQRGLDDLRRAFAGGARAPLYVLPTGGGKGTLIAAIAQSAVARGSRVCVIAHRKEILRDLAGRIGPSAALLAPWVPGDPAAPVQVASVQTLTRRAVSLPAPELVITDEAHHAVAGSYRAIYDAWPSARGIGFTATPERRDGAGLCDVFDAHILGPSVAELTAAGHLVPAEIYAPSAPDLAGVRSRAGEFAADDLEAALARSTITGDAVASWHRYSARRGVAFCASVAHARRTAEAFLAAGVRAAVLTGEDADADRDRIMSGLASGDIDLLATVDIVGEGVDIPEIDTVVDLRPTQSLAVYLQHAGRALRPAPGKHRALLLDHAGNVWRHGMPAEPRTWTLDAPKRRRRAEAGGDAFPIQQCPQCYHVHPPAPACPSCGAAAPVRERAPEEREGALARVDPAEVERLRRERWKEEGRAQSLADFLAIANERGYSPAWARIRWKIRQQRRAA